MDHDTEMAQLIEGNPKVNTNCSADIKVKGKKVKGKGRVIWCNEKWRHTSHINGGGWGNLSSGYFPMHNLQ